MKRIEQLQLLSKEHHQSLVLAKKCKDILKEESAVDEVKAFCFQLKAAFETQWIRHFKIEENTIFNVAEKKSEEISKICQQLKKEHKILESMVVNIAKGNYQLLNEFGQLLYDHTRLEERQLFPLVEQLFTQDELDNIMNY